MIAAGTTEMREIEKGTVHMYSTVRACPGRRLHGVIYVHVAQFALYMYVHKHYYKGMTWSSITVYCTLHIHMYIHCMYM